MLGGGTHPTHKLLSTPTSICFGKPTQEMASKSSKRFLSCPPAHSAPQMMEGTISLCRSLHPSNARSQGTAGSRAGGAGWGVRAPQLLALPPHSLGKPLSKPSFPGLGVFSQVRHLGVGSSPGLYSCAGDKGRVRVRVRLRGSQIPAFSACIQWHIPMSYPTACGQQPPALCPARQALHPAASISPSLHPMAAGQAVA